MIFTNYQSIAGVKTKRFILQLLDKSIRSMLPRQVMPQNVRIQGDNLIVQNQRFSLKHKRVFVIGAGKAGATMAVALEKILGEKRITAGVVLTNDRSVKPKKIQIHYADHPVPSRRGVAGVHKILSLKEKFQLTKDDLIIALLSGGGSSLMPAPRDSLTLRDKIKTVKALLRSGASVHEITIVKKKISKVKGGQMAAWFFPTPIISLVISDVVGNDPQVIASGPFTPDRTTYYDAWQVIKKYKIELALPRRVWRFLQKMRKQYQARLRLKNVQQFILADNDQALACARQLGLKAGYVVLTEGAMQGEARVVAHTLCAQVFRRAVKQPTLYLYGGETTVTLPPKHGQGGRNQEFILACLDFIQTHNIKHKFCIASVATDGIDFIHQSAGGIIDNSTSEILKKKKLNVTRFLNQHNAYRILSKINANLRVGKPTGTNVGDLGAFLVLPA